MHYSGVARGSMTKVTYGYAVGLITSCELSDCEYRELKKISVYVTREVKVFERLYFNNMIIHTVNYRNGHGKRNSSYLCYKNINGEETFGVVQRFAESLQVGVILPFTKTRSNILKTSGRPCREVLESYAQMSLISQFIIEIQPNFNVSPEVILVKDIISKCILVDSYIVKIPNRYEHH